MGNTVGRIWIIGIRDIVEEDHWIVLWSILPTSSERAISATNAFLIRLPGYACITQQRDKVLRGTLVIGSWISVIADAKISACLQPQIIWFAWVISWRVIVLFSI